MNFRLPLSRFVIACVSLAACNNSDTESTTASGSASAGDTSTGGAATASNTNGVSDSQGEGSSSGADEGSTSATGGSATTASGTSGDSASTGSMTSGSATSSDTSGATDATSGATDATSGGTSDGTGATSGTSATSGATDGTSASGGTGGTSDATGGTGGATTGGNMAVEFGPCDLAACTGDAEACFAANVPADTVNHGYNVCSAQDCATPTDCGAAPSGGNPTIECADVFGADEINDCYLSCANGETCPDGMFCTGDSICLWRSEWTCDLNYMHDADCDCGCGLVDSACADETVASCTPTACGDVGACSWGASDCNVILPSDNSRCIL